MKSNESVQDLLAQVSTVASHKKTYGEKISDDTMVAKVLRSLNPRFDHIVAVIEESKDLSKFSFDELMCSLQAYETQINISNVKDEEMAFQTKGEHDYSSQHGRGRVRGGYQRRGQERYISLKCSIYSGCSHHMIGDRTKFKDLDEGFKSQVRLGDNKQLRIEGQGLQLLHNKEMVCGLPTITPLDKTCEGCMIGKKAKLAFPTGKAKRAEDVLELIHDDLCGPMSMESPAG
ncbi:hypothetical protein Tco_1557112, partial [Tanacetum coccineum]